MFNWLDSKITWEEYYINKIYKDNKKIYLEETVLTIGMESSSWSKVRWENKIKGGMILLVDRKDIWLLMLGGIREDPELIDFIKRKIWNIPWCIRVKLISKSNL